MAYASLSDYKAMRPATRDGLSDTQISAALDIASDDIDEWCQRSFAVSSGTSAKTYRQTSTGVLLVDDFSTLTGLVVAEDSTTLTINEDFYVDAARTTAHPFYRIRFSPDRWLVPSWKPLLSVTANWGWAAIPDQVKRATILLAADLMAAGSATFGAVTFGDVGALVRIRQNLIVEGLLRSFRRGDRTAL